MNISKRLGKLTYSSELEKKHSKYKECIINQVEYYMNNGLISGSEVCTSEKSDYYNTLHEVNKIEHDSLIKYNYERILTAYNYK